MLTLFALGLWNRGLMGAYEQASEASKKWIEGTLLHRLETEPAILVAIGGQITADFRKFVWKV